MTILCSKKLKQVHKTQTKNYYVIAVQPKPDKMYGIPRGTIRNWIIKCKKGEDFYTDHRSLVSNTTNI